MALLSAEKRKEYFKALGIGSYNKTNILKFQRTAFSNKKEHDGIYGTKTDIALRHWYAVWKNTKNFRPEEFKCTCGKCTGYPTYMKVEELKLIQAIRDHWNKPVTITSGLRCKASNSATTGSINASKHLTGQAVDFYQVGVTDTLANRKKALAWIKKQPNFTYGYGNGINSNGYAVKAAYMGNALHVDTGTSSSATQTPTAAAAKPATSKASQINAKALEFAWPVGTAEKKYKKKGGAPCAAFKTAWKKYFPKKKYNTGCHTFVMLVLKACGYPTMPVSKGWSQIMKYLRANFKEIKPNFTQAQLKPGDIRVHKNSSGGWHIWIIVEQNGKFYRAEANQGTSNDRYAHINKSNSGNLKKHKGDWLFRAK